MTKFKKINHDYHLDKEEIRGVLGGKVSQLWYAFTWDLTPQGYNHWESIFMGRRKLSKRSRRYLNKLLSA